MQEITQFFTEKYELIISAAALIGVVSLIVSGFRLLSSAGDPQRITDAKKHILGVFVGLLLLFSSYFILKTINPELVEINIPELKPLAVNPLSQPPLKQFEPDLLSTIKETAEGIKVSSGLMNKISQEIVNLTNNCDCGGTLPICICTGGSGSSVCKPRSCYAEDIAQPCPGALKIKENQKLIIAWKNEISYYKQKAKTESDELKNEINNIIVQKYTYYQKNINIETNQKVIKYLKEIQEKIKKEWEIKVSLTEKLSQLAKLIENIKEPAENISSLPDQCLKNVQEKCQASCKGKCHDYADGCQPDKCSGGNPCPAGEIQSQANSIQNTVSSLKPICNEVVNLIDQLNKLKTINY